MNPARSIIASGCAALSVALFTLGCASASSGMQHAKAPAKACTQCTITVVDRVPLPVSTDGAVVRLDESWTIVEHTCDCCEIRGARFFADSGFQDACLLDAETGLCCVSQHGQANPGLVRLDR